MVDLNIYFSIISANGFVRCNTDEHSHDYVSGWQGTTGRTYPFPENCRQHAMPCTLHTWHTTGIPSPKRNSINFVILEGGRRDARSLLLTAGLHHYANNTASRNDPLFVIHDEALSRKV